MIPNNNDFNTIEKDLPPSFLTLRKLESVFRAWNCRGPNPINIPSFDVLMNEWTLNYGYACVAMKYRHQTHFASIESPPNVSTLLHRMRWKTLDATSNDCTRYKYLGHCFAVGNKDQRPDRDIACGRTVTDRLEHILHKCGHEVSLFNMQFSTIKCIAEEIGFIFMLKWWKSDKIMQNTTNTMHVREIERLLKPIFDLRNVRHRAWVRTT